MQQARREPKLTSLQFGNDCYCRTVIVRMDVGDEFFDLADDEGAPRSWRLVAAQSPVGFCIAMERTLRHHSLGEVWSRVV